MNRAQGSVRFVLMRSDGSGQMRREKCVEEQVQGMSVQKSPRMTVRREINAQSSYCSVSISRVHVDGGMTFVSRFHQPASSIQMF